MPFRVAQYAGGHPTHRRPEHRRHATLDVHAAGVIAQRGPLEETAQGWRRQGAAELHVLRGWLQVDQKYRVADIGPNDLPWARHHPHLASKYRDEKNTVYAAAMTLDLGGDDDRRDIAGWGVFPRFDLRLVLTDPNGAGVSNWRLPRWFYPEGNKPPLTYHPDRKRWRHDAEHTYLQTVGRGQEFVLDLAHYPEAVEWLSDLVSNLGSSTGSS